MMDGITFSGLFWDGLFAAIAAVGFAIISNPPRKTLLISAVLAAVGHSTRYLLMNLPFFETNIASASFVAALLIGCLALPFAHWVKVPVEVFTFPSLLPMIPGVFAYRSIQSLAKFLGSSDSADSQQYINLFFFNGLTTVFVLAALVVGIAIPFFIFRKQTFSVTRDKKGPFVQVAGEDNDL
ncbi:MAG: threonine/serine exporter family protein [Bacteroidota bacterium]|nr:threonine/serine exporter family protein [Bacteroidota bacterium]